MERDDSILLKRWMEQGDAEAFRELVTHYADLAYATAVRILRNPTDAEDVTQDVFLTLAQRADAKQSLGAWLHRVATNKSLDARHAGIRRKKRESGWSMEHGKPDARMERHPRVSRRGRRQPPRRTTRRRRRPFPSRSSMRITELLR